MSIDRRTMLLATLSFIGLPAALALTEAISFFSANRSNGELVSSGRTRDYVLHVPTTYDSRKPTPLVISMHGAGLWGAAQRDISQWDRVADREGLIVVYPSGTTGVGPRIWHVDSSAGLQRDVTFISELIDTLRASYNIDPARIYANGFSNGGGMAFVLSCTLSDRIAAVGMVGAAQTLPWEWCRDRRAVPMIAFHGTNDRAAPYAGGPSGVTSRPFPRVTTWVTHWARRNGCAAGPVDTVLADDVTRRAYSDCDHDADVALYTLQGGGHTWPGGMPLSPWWIGTTNRNIDASSVMWEFFRGHPLQPDTGSSTPFRVHH